MSLIVFMLTSFIMNISSLVLGLLWGSSYILLGLFQKSYSIFHLVGFLLAFSFLYLSFSIF